MATMTVTINDRAADHARWGRASNQPQLRTVTISDRCPVCGGPRGEPTPRSFYEDGWTYSVSCWTNPCGHIDRYADVLREAAS